ncbi:MAG: peptidoglycan DD-metalloendopeptidase family protein [Deltaproteobacteria bacterium]|nr:peptidoglycan DD-metalloendopeptidase family protein [Deltaproteobacteria bacterium]
MQDIKVNFSKYMHNENGSKQKNDALKKACREFESVFAHEILKSMRRTIEKVDLFHGGQGEEIYESMLDQELSKKLAGYGSNSLTDLLYQQLKRNDISEGAQLDDISYDDNNRSRPLWPLKAPLSSGYGWRKDPFTGEDRFHHGIDLAAEEGTEIRASMPGKVIISEYREGYGNMVALDHGRGYVTIYAHNKDNLVKQGDRVTRGAPLATVGSTGRSTGPHLHFEIRRHGQRMDPLEFLGA